MIAGVLIPTYNRVGFLREALASARGQSHRLVEILVMDNGSTDGTSGFMRTIDDPRVRYVVNPENVGLIGSINRGVRLFSPAVDWITVLADDDLLDPGFVESCLACVETAGGRAVVDGHRVFIDKEGRKIRDAHRPEPVATAFGFIRARASFWRESYLSGVFFCRDAFESAGGYPVFSTGAGTDDAFIFALALRDRLRFCPQAVARIRIHDEAESRNAGQALDHLKSTSEFEAFVVGKAEGSGLFGRRKLASLRKWVRGYVAMSNDLFWNARAALAVGEAGPARADGIGVLCAAAKEGAFPFTARTRANAFLLGRGGLFLESNPAYRAFWRLVKLLNIVRMRLA